MGATDRMAGLRGRWRSADSPLGGPFSTCETTPERWGGGPESLIDMVKTFF